jgi:hypothetical protein
MSHSSWSGRGVDGRDKPGHDPLPGCRGYQLGLRTHPTNSYRDKSPVFLSASPNVPCMGATAPRVSGRHRMAETGTVP